MIAISQMLPEKLVGDCELPAEKGRNPSERNNLRRD